MKRIFLSAIPFASVLLLSSVGFSQTNRTENNEEIIIRKNDDSNTKTVIVIDSNDVTINGSPVKDYKGDVKVIRRKFMKGNSENELLFPGARFNLNRMNNLDLMNRNRAFLGVLSEKSAKGALIKKITEGSSAEKAGLKAEDIITKVEDKKITSPEDLARAVRAYKPGDEIKIDYLRNGKKKDIKVKLGKTNDMSMAFNFNDDSLGLNGRNFNFRMNRIPELENFPFWNRNQPKLGLQIQETEDNSGVKILNVEENSPAAKAGLQKGDLIQEINSEKVNSVQDVLSQITHPENKNNFKIKAKRNNSEMNFEVQIPKQLRSANL